jgi:hypothetical protein
MMPKTRSKYARWLHLLSVCWLLAGCSKGPPYGDVAGKITLDGRDVASGSIRFVPLDGMTSTAGGTITDGTYSVRVPVNKVRIEISAVGGQPAQSGMSAPSETDLVASGNYVMPTELVPAKYNTKSELTLDVVEGNNPANYDLKSK